MTDAVCPLNNFAVMSRNEDFLLVRCSQNVLFTLILERKKIWPNIILLV